jgi:hypothetical protein
MRDELIIKSINKYNTEIIKKLLSRRHFQDYIFIKQEFSKNGVASEKFKKSFCRFYILNGPMGLNFSQKIKFFALLSKKEDSLKKILSALYKVSGFGNLQKLYLVFASKLIHTLDNSIPIYDSQIASILDLPNQINGISLKERLENRMHIHDELKRRFDVLLENKKIAAILKKNRKYFVSCGNLKWQDNLITNTKLLDSILWALHIVKKKKEKSKNICLCDNPTCAKCLVINCRNDNCKIHSVESKIRARERILANMNLNKDKVELLKKEILRLKNIKSDK